MAEEGAKEGEAAEKDDDVVLPVVDPMLAPFGDEAEEEMRKKLKRRLKDLRKAKKAEKKEKREKRKAKEEADGFPNVVKQKKEKKKEKEKERPRTPDEDGYRMDRHERNHRVDPDEVMDTRFFPYKEVYYDDQQKRPRKDPWEADERDAGGRAISSRVAAAPSRSQSRGPGRGSDAERWGHDGFHQRHRSPPLPPEYHRGQQPGQRRGLGSYEARSASRGPGTSGGGGGGGGGGHHYRDDHYYKYSNGQEPEGGDWRQRKDRFGRDQTLRNRYEGGTRKAFPRSPSPPRRTRPQTPPDISKTNMPAHLKWLHDRWSKYDSAFFEPSKHSLPSVPDPLRNPAEEAAHRRDLDDIQKAKDKKKRLRKAKDGRPAEEEDPYAHLPKSSRNHMPFYVRDEIKFGRMKSFKEFLLGHHEDVQNQERATQLYNEYKLQFRQRAFAEFFQQHSEDEWFLEKYHPVVKAAKDSRRKEQVKHRLDVFMQLLVRGWMELHLDPKDSRQIRKLMDAAIVLMEGGDEGDIACLSDLDYVLEEKKEETYESQGLKTVLDVSDSSSDSEDESGRAPTKWGTEDERAEMPSEEALEEAQHAKDYSHYVQKRVVAAVDVEDVEGDPAARGAKLERRTEYLGSGVFVQQVVDPKRLQEMNLHKVSAIMVRNIPPLVPRAEIESLVSDTHGGFLRFHVSAPDPANRYHRTAIVSYWHNANLQKIIWKIRGIHMRGVPIVVIEYREFKRKIDWVDGLAGDKSVVLRDIQLCKSLVEYLDKKMQLWGNLPERPRQELAQPLNPAKVQSEQRGQSGMVNPLLVNLDECLALHLREMLDAGREPGKPLSKKKQQQDETAPLVERDEELCRVLDRLVLYLRIVHSVDYYGAKHYEEEDEQPRRLGMMTLRGQPSRRASHKALAAYVKRFEAGLAGLVPQDRRLAPEHVELLGKRDTDQEVDRFVKHNILTVGDGMSRCTICHKRFTTQHYAEMHLRERHADKLEEVKWVVVTFNSYLADPERPSDADFSAAQPAAPPPDDDHPDRDFHQTPRRKADVQRPAFLTAFTFEQPPPDPEQDD